MKKMNNKTQNIICFIFIILSYVTILSIFIYENKDNNKDIDNNTTNGEILKNDFENVKKSVTTKLFTIIKSDVIIGEKLNDVEIKNDDVKKIYDFVKDVKRCNYGVYDGNLSSKIEFDKDLKMFYVLNNYELKNYELPDKEEIEVSYYFNVKEVLNAYKKVYNENYGNMMQYRYDGCPSYEYDKNANKIFLLDQCGCVANVNSVVYKYEENENEINVYNSYAFVGNNEVYKSNVGNDAVYKNIEEFYFTKNNIDKFNKIKFNFQKNNNGVWTIKYAERIK